MAAKAGRGERSGVGPAFNSPWRPTTPSCRMDEVVSKIVPDTQPRSSGRGARVPTCMNASSDGNLSDERRSPADLRTQRRTPPLIARPSTGAAYTRSHFVKGAAAVRCRKSDGRAAIFVVARPGGIAWQARSADHPHRGRSSSARTLSRLVPALDPCLPAG